jgi:hypothetical protein
MGMTMPLPGFRKMRMVGWKVVMAMRDNFGVI